MITAFYQHHFFSVQNNITQHILSSNKLFLTDEVSTVTHIRASPKSWCCDDPHLHFCVLQSIWTNLLCMQPF